MNIEKVMRWFRGWRWISREELQASLASRQECWVIDVRSPEEFSGPLGHIQGADNIPLPLLMRDIAQIRARKPGLPVVLVCLTDKRSSAAANLFSREGRKDVSVLRGGMKGWSTKR